MGVKRIFIVLLNKHYLGMFALIALYTLCLYFGGVS